MRPEMNEDDEVKIIVGEHRAINEAPINANAVATSKMNRYLLPLCGVLVGMLCLVFYLLFTRASSQEKVYETSFTADEVMAGMERYKPDGAPVVELVVDSVNDVVFKLFTLKNLTMQIVTNYPDETDSTLYFVSRAMDYRKADRTIIGKYVQLGEIQGVGESRKAFMGAVDDGLPQIGVGDNSKVLDFVAKRKGYLISQFALVSAGEMCLDQYELKGKVTRAAYTWRASDPATLYFMESLTRETLYDFSEAIIEYGFSDAIYITDGVWKNRFYRISKGEVADVTSADDKKDDRQYIVLKTILPRK